MAEEAATRTEFKVTPQLLSELGQLPENEMVSRMSKFSRAERNQVMQSLANGVDVDDAPAPAAPPAPAEVTPEIPPPSEEGDPDPGSETPSTEKLPEGHFKNVKRTAKYWADVVAKREARARELEAQNADLEQKLKDAAATKVDAPADMFDPKSQEDLYAKVQRLSRTVEVLEHNAAQRGKSEVSQIRETLADSKEKAVFKSMEELQADFPALQTTTPVEKLDKQYGEFLAELIPKSGITGDNPELVRQQAWDKYNSDPEFQKQLSKKPPNAEDFEKMKVLLRAHHATSTRGGTLLGNMLELMHQNGVLKENFKTAQSTAAVESATKTMAAVAGKQIKTIEPSDGRTKANAGAPSQSDMKATLQGLHDKQKRGQKWTDAERQLHSQYLRALTAGS